MASLQEKKRKSGTAFLIQFMLNRERRSLFLDVKYSREDAEEIKRVVEKCVDAIETDNPLDRRTIAWLENVNDDLQTRLVACGLVKRDESGDVMTIADLFDAFVRDSERKKKPSTVKFYELALRTLGEWLDDDVKITDFQRKDALEVLERLRESNYAPTTQRALLVAIKAAFNWAIDREMIDRNPFARISRPGGTRNKSREFYVDRDLFQKMLDCCINAEERALLTLYRVGGLRSSEAFCVKWNDVDFENNRLVVHSPKTERVEGKDERIIPLFPELRDALIALRDEPRQLVSNLQKTRVRKNYVVSFARGYGRVVAIVERAGIERYPRLIQNLRSSASIDVFRKYGELAENAWLGHSTVVAKDHYLHPIDSDFNNAVNGGMWL